MLENITIYETTHEISQTICRALASGLRAPLARAHNGLLPGPAVVYGLLRGCDEIIRHCQTVGRDFWHIDNGIFKPGHYDGYYRVSRNGLQNPVTWDPGMEPPEDRWLRLGIPIEPWRKNGRKVLVVPPSDNQCQWNHFDSDLWVERVKEEISNHTDRPIEVKGKEKKGMAEALKDTWCVVTYNSMAAKDALLAGVPCITLYPDHVFKNASWEFANLESPVWFDREPYFYGAAYRQFTLEELRTCRKSIVGSSPLTMTSYVGTSIQPQITSLSAHIFGIPGLPSISGATSVLGLAS